MRGTRLGNRPARCRGRKEGGGATHRDAVRWVVVLAGGQGRRVGHLTRDPHGIRVPKQFWDFGTGVTLLRRTLDRAEALVPRARIVAAVDERHRRWWEPALRALPAGNVVVQTRDFGTALGVLGPLIRIVLSAPRAVVLVLPSDHFVERERVLKVALQRAFDEAEGAPGQVVMLGITPGCADPDYGWLVPAESGAVGWQAEAPPQRVESFSEKPGPIEAQHLMTRGALWSSFIFAATANTLLEIYRSIRPGLLRGYLARARAAQWDPLSTLDLEGLPAFDFSRDLLEHCTGQMRVIRVPPSGWTDLGTPARVEAWQERRSELLSA